MADEDSQPPPAGAKGWADPRPWMDVEHAVVRALTAVDAQLAPGQDFELTLAYVPFSRLGEQDGMDPSVDLSWEVMITPAGREVQQYELAGHPASALEVVAAQAPAHLPSIVDDGVVARWAGWAPLLQQLARTVCRLPDDDAGLDISVYRRGASAGQPRGQSGGRNSGRGRSGRRSWWRWSVEVPVPGAQWPASAWSGSTPGSALRQALDEAEIWLSGRPAGHLLLSDDELAVLSTDVGDTPRTVRSVT
ncbi:hypothetical protein [Kineococcus sp. SYSU DK002]|uniref:hypothetical protein n=1 Tax=Kineococcus sp. SYSU DK002 TaxID=3383123 RepID=UPI003D7E879A